MLSDIVVCDYTQMRVVPLGVAAGASAERLVKLKDKYDPGNLFRLNANIKPQVKS